jgi:hypothetical protein
MGFHGIDNLQTSFEGHRKTLPTQRVLIAEEYRRIIEKKNSFVEFGARKTAYVGLRIATKFLEPDMAAGD